MRGDQPAGASGEASIEQADGEAIEEAERDGRSAEPGSQLPGEVEKRAPRNRLGPEYFEHQGLLAEVAGLIADGLDPDEAAEIVGVDIRGEKLPARFAYMPSPATIDVGCLDVQSTWSDTERRRRNMRPAARWELIETSAAELTGEMAEWAELIR